MRNSTIKKRLTFLSSAFLLGCALAGNQANGQVYYPAQSIPAQGIFPNTGQVHSQPLPPQTVTNRPSSTGVYYPSGQAPPAHGVINYSSLPGSATPHTPVALAWHQTITNDRNHDFGSVARASTQEHIFEFKNTTGQDLFLNSIKASCGCTKPSILTQHVKPGETAKIKAQFDTLNHYGKKGATLTVKIQKADEYPLTQEMQFAVRGIIRRDVVFNPGEFLFSDIPVEETAQRTAKIQYAGKPDWKILAVKSTTSDVTVEFKETFRDPATKRTDYEMVAVLSGEQPAGMFMEELTLITNDPKTTGMRVKVSGNIKKTIQVSAIKLGLLHQGQRINKRLILKAPEPVSIWEIRTNDPRIQFAPISTEQKSLHTLSYTLDTKRVGDIKDIISIRTSDSPQTNTQVKFSAQIIGSTFAKNDH